MNTTHTPGPWHVGAGNGWGSIFADSGRKRLEAGGTTLYPICMMNTGYLESEDEANARLIAAAPDLLAALQGCIKVMQCADELSSNARFWIEEATTTISKAKGIPA